jgi:hypothetical protein
MCNIKAVVDDRFPINRPNKMYPVTPAQYSTFGGVIDLVYGRGIRQRWGGLLKLLGIRK